MDARRYAIGLLSAMISLLLLGCGSAPVRYSTKERRLFIPKETIPMKIAVARFPDNRPEEEKDRSKRKVAEGESAGDYSDDTDFSDKDMGRGLARMTAIHLNESGLFDTVQFVDIDRKTAEADPKSDALKGYDAVLVGDVSHFWGYMHKSLFRTIFFLPLGGSGYFIDHAIKTPVKGGAEFSDVKLISTKNGEVLYQGTLTSGFDESQAFTGGRTDKSLEAWRVAVNKMTEAISASKLGPRVARAGLPVTTGSTALTERQGRAQR